MAQDNVCSRCGQNRILTKSWQEEIVTGNGTSKLSYNQYSCPDADCQTKIEAELEKKRLETIDRERMSQERDQARLKSRAEAIKNSRKKVA